MARKLKPADWVAIHWAQSGLDFDPRRPFVPELSIDAPGWRLKFLHAIQRQVPGVLAELREKVWPLWEKTRAAKPGDPRLTQWEHLEYDSTPEAIELKRVLLAWAKQWQLAPGGFTESPAESMHLSARVALQKWRADCAEIRRVAEAIWIERAGLSATVAKRKRKEFIRRYLPRKPVGAVEVIIPARMVVAEQGSAGRWFLSAALETMNSWFTIVKYSKHQLVDAKEQFEKGMMSAEEVVRQVEQINAMVESLNWHAGVVGGAAYYLPELDRDAQLREPNEAEVCETLPAISPLQWKFDTESPHQFMERAVHYLAASISKLEKLGVGQVGDQAPPGWRDHLDRFAMFHVGGMAYTEITKATGLEKGAIGNSIKRAAALVGIEPRDTKHAPRPRRRKANFKRSNAEKSSVGRLEKSD